MTARDDLPVLAWHAYYHEKTKLGVESAQALDEIDRLRAEVAEWVALDEYLRP